MIKVAIIIERADVALGGAERSTFELTSQLSALGADITLLAAKGNSKAKNIKVLCEDQSSKRTSMKVYEAAIKKHLAENHYDIVHSMLPFGFADVYQPRGGSYPEAIIGNSASYEKKFVAFYKQLTNRLNARRSSLLRAEKNLCLNGTAIVAALSNYVRDQFKKHYSLPDERIAVIPNGVKVDKQINQPQAQRLEAQIYKQLAIKKADDPVFFLFAANNFRLKGLTPLIKAMATVKQAKTQRPGYLIVAGAGSSRRYRILARQYRVRDRILFLGRLRHIQEALSICNAAVLPTYYDPCSRFILEALSYSKPVITTKFNGASEPYTSGTHGFTINRPGNVPALAEAIKAYCNTETIQRTAQAIIDDNLKYTVSINRHGKEVIELYEEILRNKRQ